MQIVLTPGQMAAADKEAAESGIPSFQLMQSAGRAVGRLAAAMMGGTYGRRVTLVCGKGNNGGDGCVAASYLARRGAFCTVILLADPAALKGDALEAYRQLAGSPVHLVRYSPGRLAHELPRSHLVLDAMVGTGFAGSLRGPMAEAAGAINAASVPVLAVDIPSGVNGETGQVEGEAVRASRTVTLAALKTGLLLQPGASYAGDVEVVDIGIPQKLLRDGISMAESSDLRGLVPPRPATAHKRSVGKVLVVAGSVSMAGAVALTASAALHAGAGLVRMAVPKVIRPSVGPLVIEALTAGMPDTPKGAFSLEAVPQVVDLAAQMQVVALGPGIGKDDETLKFVQEILSQVDRPVVLDADALSAFQDNPEGLRSRLAPTILTPHSGELGRLIGRSPKDIDADRIAAARQTAERTQAVVLLKGFRTVVAAPDGRVVVVNAGGPVLATGGSGDVLTGVIAALVPLLDPFDAAWAGSCLHGLAGEMLARERGDRGVVAGDLLKALPLALRQATA
ncbi:MAG TPA: NAD(P)H-hydrate dehydratase [Actinomycetota bacterium]|nr:NAD(P)H-hydrate dehydratase [Actinomycetota bacterium]